MLAIKDPRSLWKNTVTVIYVAAAGFLVAHSINAFIAQALYLPPKDIPRPPSPDKAVSGAWSPALLADRIKTSGLFPLPAVPTGPFAGSDPNVPPGASPMATPLALATKIKLLGVVLGGPQGGGAIIEELSSRRQGFYRLHGQIPDIGEIVEVRRTGILVRQGSQQEFLELAVLQVGTPAPVSTAAPGGPAGKASKTGSILKVLDRREVDQAIADLPKLLTQARAVPYLLNGAIAGFRVDYIARGSFYEKIGLLKDDILQQVNGVEIRDPGTMMNLFQQLKNERTVKLDVLRNNQPATLSYELR